MPIKLHWYLPTNGDGRSLLESELQRASSPRRASVRAPSIAYLGMVAKAAELAGFEAILTPTGRPPGGRECEEGWMITAALTQVTDRLKYLIAVRPGLVSPMLVAHQAATFQRISDGRLMLNIVTGADEAEQRRYGDNMPVKQRYERTEEFLAILRGLWGGEPFSFQGNHLHIDDAQLDDPPDMPPIYFGGSSDAAQPVAGRYADVHLTWGEPPQMIAQKIERLRSVAAVEGRRLRFGIRAPVVTRETADEAWAAADRLLAGADKDTIATMQKRFAEQTSVGQQRLTALHQGDPDKLELYPNLWAGIGLIRVGAGTAFVGSYDDVARLMSEYNDVGVEEFILSGYPHLEEIHEVAEGLVPALHERGLFASAGD